MDVSSFSGRAGLALAGTGAPLAIWPIASSSQNRGTMLRAHTLYTNGIITTDVMGRQLAFMTTEFRHPVYFSPYGNLSVAAFADSARAWRRRIEGPSRFETDIGAGIRIDAPTTGGQLRLDFAYGLQNKLTHLSAAYVLPWGQ
jgi:outer membrane protein assembly factor BamA